MPGGGLADARDYAIRSNLDSAIQTLTEAIVETDSDFSRGHCVTHQHNSEAKDKLARFQMLWDHCVTLRKLILCLGFSRTDMTPFHPPELHDDPEVPERG